LMILDGSTVYHAYGMTRFFGMFIALLLTIITEYLIMYYSNKKWKIFEDPEVLFLSITTITLANVITFFLGMILFMGGI